MLPVAKQHVHKQLANFIFLVEHFKRLLTMMFYSLIWIQIHIPYRYDTSVLRMCFFNDQTIKK